MPTNREVTEQIVAAWAEELGEDTAEDTVVDTEEPANEEESEETPAQEPETDDSEEDTEEDTEEDEEEGDEEEEELEEPVGFQSDDPEVQAFLAKYQGDVEKALRAEAQQQRVIGQQGHELAELRRQAQEQAAELERVNALTQSPAYLSGEQQQWLDQVMESADPRAAVKAAVDAQEFDLARAVCDRWAEEQPYEAARVAQQVDQLETRHSQQETAQEEPQQIDYPALFGVLSNYYPELPQFSERMTELVGTLGENHLLVQDARSPDPETAARGIIGIYEIARASTATVKQTKERIRKQQQVDADAAREDGVVSTATATPHSSETPRSGRLGPGLTLEELDAAWDK